MYIRFVVGKGEEDHRQLTGVITESRLLIESGELQTYEAARLVEIYVWLRENLPCPPFSSNEQLKKGVCWFKPGANEAIAKIWEIVSLLKENDIPVRMLRSRMPGRCLYEDKFQIVFEERKTL